MTKDNIHTYIRHPELIDNNILENLEDIIKEYPYFNLARILYLKTLYSKNIERFRLELSKSTIYLPDKKQLFKYLNENTDLSSLRKKTENIEEIFQGNDKLSTRHKEDDLLAFEVSDISISPAYHLENETKKLNTISYDENKDNQQLIDDFIRNTPRISKTVNKDISNPILLDKTELDDECMTETLAKIYVKQKLYSKAILVYEKLSLKNPQKSVYFVNHMIEIKKLINDKL